MTITFEVYVQAEALPGIAYVVFSLSWSFCGGPSLHFCASAFIVYCSNMSYLSEPSGNLKKHTDCVGLKNFFFEVYHSCHTQSHNVPVDGAF